MRTNTNKILIIVLIVIAVLAIVGGTFAYMFFATDVFKSGQELFAKYLTQNINELTQTVGFQKLDEVESQLKEKSYEENISISYVEAGETDPIAEITIDTQNDPINKKNYGIVSLLLEGLEETETLQVEYMKESDMYSLRFTNIVKQFLTVENANLKQLAKNLGADEEALELIPNTIDFSKFSLDELKFTEEEKKSEIEKYSNLLYNNISKEKYTKTKNTVITLNSKTITTNAYTLTLNIQDLKALTLKLFETLKQDEIILSKLQILDEKLQEYVDESIKDSYDELMQELIDSLNEEETEETEEVSEENIIITIYEEKGKTVRIKFEQGLDTITLDTTETEGKKQIDFNFTSIDEENTQLSEKITFVKENDNKLNVTITNIEGEEQNVIEYSAELTQKDNNTKLNCTIETESEQILFSRNINLVETIDYKVTLDNSNNIVLNDLSSDKLLVILNAVGERLTTEYIEPLKSILAPVLLADEIVNMGADAMQNTNLVETEISLFNAKFQAYEGDMVSTVQVNELLNTLHSHNKQELDNQTERYVTVSGIVTLETDSTEVTLVEGTDYYTVTCKTGDEGLINEIVINKFN